MELLAKETVLLNARAADKFEAIRMCGELLVRAGYAEAGYVEKMIERERALSTYMGGGLAIPHGTADGKEFIRRTGLSIVQIPEGVDFGDGERAYLLVGIAAVGDDHLELLTSVAMVCSDDDNLENILQADSEEQLIRIFESGMGA